MDLLVFPLLFIAMWFLLIRPQQQRARRQRELVAGISVGAEVVTVGGIIGTVRTLGEDEMVLEVGPGVELRVLRAAISRRLDRVDDGAPRDDQSADDERDARP